jgi:hypothetical protein
MINDSSGIQIENNTISDLSSQLSDEYSSISLGIMISNSTDSNVNKNIISRIHGGSTSAITVDRGDTHNVESNIISDITTFFAKRSESFGILIVNNSGNTVIENEIKNITANNFLERSFGFGISVADVKNTTIDGNSVQTVEAIADRPDSFGIHAASSEDIRITNNFISEIFTKSEIETRAFSTGIYMSHSDNMLVAENELVDIIVEGRASYGIYADYSAALDIFDNSIHDLSSTSQYHNNAEAIIIRIANNTRINDNTISGIESSTINTQQITQISSAIGILLDNMLNTSLNNNDIQDISSTAYQAPTDSIGILASTNNNIDLVSNQISKVNSNGYDSFSIGLIISKSSNVLVESNTINQVKSISNVFMASQSFSRNILFQNNSLKLTGDGDQATGIHSTKNFNEVLNYNTIIVNQKSRGLSAIVVSFGDNFRIENNELLDVTNNSIGLSVRSGENGNIKENTISNFLLWMEMNIESNGVVCDNNIIDEIIKRECLIGDFHDLVSNPQDGSQSSLHDGLTIDSQTKNNSSLLIFLMLLPIFMAATTATIVKRDQLKQIASRD